MYSPGGSEQRLAVGPIDLVVKEKIGSQPAGRVRINASQLVADDESGRRRLAVEILHAQDDFDGRHAVKQDRHAVAKAEVLRPLADVKADVRLALARRPAM